jgi:hypothetical protein
METPVINRDQLLTIGDLESFKADLLREIAGLLQTKSPSSVKQWLRTSEVREMLGVSPGTLQTLRISRKVSFTKIGSIVFYKYEDVMALLEKNCVPKSKSIG